MPYSYRLIPSLVAYLAVALMLSACASSPWRADPDPSGDDQQDLLPPYFLRAHVEDPFERIDRAIERIGSAQLMPEADPELPTEPPVDIWQRLVDRFEFSSCPRGSQAEQWAEWFGERQDYLGRVMVRAHPWLHDIAEQIEARDLPGELALVPIVESAYDPFAYSHGQASGAWQFVAATGREYGLEINEYYDGRRDLHAATRAALEYLETLSRRFDGDWNLALAAYNGGQGRVARAIRRNETRGRSTHWSELGLPRETLAYVPKVNGLGCLFRTPERYGWQRPEWLDQAQITRIVLEGPIDIVQLSVHADLDLTELVALNAGLSGHLTSPTGPHHIIVPRQAAARVRSVVPELDQSEMLIWREIEVQRGDTLSQLALRHDTSIQALSEANGLSSEGFLRVGQLLRIPDGNRRPENSAYADRYAELAQLQQRLLPTRRFRHVVRPGESLWVIARNYSVRVDDIRRWNQLGSSSLIRPGQRLMIEMEGPAGPGPTVSYTVRSGDSLWLIARRHRVSMTELMRWNGLDESSILQPGQTLTIHRES